MFTHTNPTASLLTFSIPFLSRCEHGSRIRHQFTSLENGWKQPFHPLLFLSLLPNNFPSSKNSAAGRQARRERFASDTVFCVYPIFLLPCVRAKTMEIVVSCGWINKLRNWKVDKTQQRKWLVSEAYFLVGGTPPGCGLPSSSASYSLSSRALCKWWRKLPTYLVLNKSCKQFTLWSGGSIRRENMTTWQGAGDLLR